MDLSKNWLSIIGHPSHIIWLRERARKTYCFRVGDIMRGLLALVVRFSFTVTDHPNATKEKDGKERTYHPEPVSKRTQPNPPALPSQAIIDLPNIPNANPDHIAPLYAARCASFGAFLPLGSARPPGSRDLRLSLSVALKTTVEIARPNAVPSWMSVWKSAPPTDCSCGRHARAMNSVPVEKKKSAPKTVMAAAGKPKAQYGAAGSIKAKRRFDVAVKSVPIAVGRCQLQSAAEWV